MYLVSGQLWIVFLLFMIESLVFIILLGCRPTAENLVPIRLDIEIDGQRFRDAFTWNLDGIL